MKVSGYQILSILILSSLTLLLSCSVKYSFSGASIPPEVKTVQIEYFKNNAPLVEGTLCQVMTDAMKDKFSAETSLNLVNENGDLFFEGTIVEYKTSPVSIQGDDQAAMNRLTIAIKVSFVNHFDENQNFETTFSRYADFPSDENLADVQEGLIEEITTVLVEDVFNKSVINW